MTETSVELVLNMKLDNFKGWNWNAESVRSVAYIRFLPEKWGQERRPDAWAI